MPYGIGAAWHIGCLSCLRKRIGAPLAVAEFAIANIENFFLNLDEPVRQEMKLSSAQQRTIVSRTSARKGLALTALEQGASAHTKPR